MSARSHSLSSSLFLSPSTTPNPVAGRLCHRRSCLGRPPPDLPVAPRCGSVVPRRGRLLPVAGHARTFIDGVGPRRRTPFPGRLRSAVLGSQSTTITAGASSWPVPWLQVRRLWGGGGGWMPVLGGRCRRRSAVVATVAFALEEESSLSPVCMLFACVVVCPSS